MKIICIGRNYKNHAKELANDIPKEPLFFLKPDTAIQPKGHPFFIPDFSNEIHHEIEIVLKISKNGKHINQNFAHNYFQKIGLGIDFTARDIQEKCKKNGLPWEIAKGFDGSAQISNIFFDKKDIVLNNIKFSLENNNITKQIGNSNNMIFSFDEIISYVSKFITLKAGDLIYTGTPSGVDKVNKGDVLTGFIEKKKVLVVKVK